MYIAYTEEQEALRQELRSYYQALLTPEIREKVHEGKGVGEATRAVVRRMGADGWLGIGWPKEYGGQGRSQIEQFIFFDESMRSGAPVPMLTINTVAPSIMHFGTDEQKAFFLPKILKADPLLHRLHRARRRHRPGSAEDARRARRRRLRDQRPEGVHQPRVRRRLHLARRAHRSNAEKHRGISMIVVDRKASGIRVDPMYLLSDHDINTVFFEDVRVPAKNVVGGVNKGWKLITNQLNHERVTLCSAGLLEQSFGETRTWAETTKLAGGGRVIDQEWVQVNLARVYAGLEFLRLINWKVAWTAAGYLDIADASTIKVFGPSSTCSRSAF
jgi:alkylation response protein AidB-like acyl-CoA dehydrogenase